MNDRSNSILYGDCHEICCREVLYGCRIIGLILPKCDLFIPNDMISVTPLHGQVERLATSGHCKTYSVRQAKLQFRREQVPDMAVNV